MPKRIIDITPPQSEKWIPGFLEKEKPPEKKKREPFFRLSHFPVKKAVIAFGVIVVLGAGSYFVSRPRLTLFIKPVEEFLTTQKEIRVDLSQGVLDAQAEVVPGQLFEATEEKLDIFKSTGSDFEGEKAQGVISVYNAFNPPSAIILREQTRFLSSEKEKIFRSLEKVYLPPAQFRGGKIVPSVTEVRVVAQEAGEEYNIGPSKFSVPGFAGTASYYSVWGESAKPMIGGLKKEVKKVTNDDLEAAKMALREKLQAAAKASLKGKVPPDFTFSDKAIFEEDFQATCSQEAGAMVAEFNCQGMIRLKGVACRTADLEKIAQEFFIAKIPSPKKMVPKSLRFSFIPKGAITHQGGMVVDFRVEGKIYEPLNNDLFLSQIKGVSQAESREIISKSYPQIKEIKFKVWPFWVKKIPKDIKRIKIALTF